MGAWNGDENIYVDPEYIEGDSLCHLSENSPCMNTGIESLEINGTVYNSPSTDYENHNRPDPFYQLFDMGADEFYVLPDAPLALDPSEYSCDYFEALWEESPWAEGYLLDVALDINFDDLLEGYVSLDVGNVTNLLVENLNPGLMYYYRLRAYNSMGVSQYSNTISVDLCVGQKELQVAGNGLQVFPVPSSGSVNLQFTLHTSRSTVIYLYSIKGIMIKRLMNEEVIAGEHLMTIDLSDLPAGIYFVRLQAGNRLETARVVVTH